MKRAAGLAALAGAGTLALEILAMRWLAPGFGTGIEVTSILIAVTLGTGALGAWCGGALAARGGALRLAFLLSGLAMLANALAGPALVDALVPLPFIAGAVLVGLALVGPTAAALGAVVPLLVARLRAPEADARAVGRLLAFATAGSLVGVLATALLALPTAGLLRTACGLSAAFVLAGVAAGRGPMAEGPASGSGGRRGPVLPTLLLLVGGACSLVGRRVPEAAILRESTWGTVTLEEGPRGRELRVDGVRQAVVPSSLGAGTLLEGRQWVEALPYLHPAARTALHVGLGGGLVPSVLAAHGIDVTSVELNPALVDVVRDGLGFRGPVLVGDGRAVWRRLEARYDLAILDAFQGETLPGHLLTQEALRELSSRLTAGGILCVHLIGRPDHRVTTAVASTLRSVLPHGLALRGGRGGDVLEDLFLFASDRPLRLPPHPDLEGAAAAQVDLAIVPALVLTDDRNPVEAWNAPLARALRARGRRP